MVLTGIFVFFAIFTILSETSCKGNSAEKYNPKYEDDTYTVQQIDASKVLPGDTANASKSKKGGEENAVSFRKKDNEEQLPGFEKVNRPQDFYDDSAVKAYANQMLGFNNLPKATENQSPDKSIVLDQSIHDNSVADILPPEATKKPPFIDKTQDTIFRKFTVLLLLFVIH